jgi:SAM-dependent methyltransferase
MVMLVNLNQSAYGLNVPEADEIKVDNNDFKKRENYCIAELKTFSSDFVSKALIMKTEKINLFNEHIAEYEAWFKKYPFVFKSELAAIKGFLSKRRNIKGIEVGLASGRFSKSLGITEGIEPAEKMRELAKEKDIFSLNAKAEKLPYRSLLFDFVLMNSCISYFDDLSAAFKEAFRVLKRGSCLIVTFIDKESTIGKYYQRKRNESIFYRDATFYGVSRIKKELKLAGFKELQFSQTLFHDLDKIKTTEKALPGYGKGSFVIVKAIK